MPKPSTSVRKAIAVSGSGVVTPTWVRKSGAGVPRRDRGVFQSGAFWPTT